VVPIDAYVAKRTAGQAVEDAQHRQHRDDDEKQERDEHRDLRRYVRAQPQSHEVLAAQDRLLRADLQQPVSEPEEEGAEHHPEADHHHRGRVRVRELERAGTEEHREHGDDERGRSEQDREREVVAAERLQRPPRQHAPLSQATRGSALGSLGARRDSACSTASDGRTRGASSGSARRR